MNTYIYLLSPAKYWKSFGNLTVELLTDGSINGVMESTIQFEKIGKDHYIYTGEGLPMEELQITVEDAGFSPYKRKRFIYSVFLAGIVGSIILVIWGIFKAKRR